MLQKVRSFEQFQHWHEKLQSLNIRGLIFTDPDAPIVQNFKQLSHDSLKQSHVSDKSDDIIGRESSLIIFDATDKFDANLFASISSTLVGGGILLVFLNQRAQDFAKNLIEKEQSQLLTTKICPLLIRVINSHIHNPSTALSFNNYFTFNQKLFEINAIESNNVFSEQEQLIEKIERVAQGHAKRPLVITANRGRGKSAALGIATANLLTSQNDYKVILCAPKTNNLQSFYKHLYKSLNQVEKKIKKHLVIPNQSQLDFVPIDEIIRHRPQANLLIIDEAAAIPIGQLEMILKSYNRIIFSTTTHGYEGNGQGFEIKFKPKLLAIYPQTRFASLEKPMRWSSQDEMEPSTYQALLLNNQLPLIQEDFVEISDVKFEIVNKDELALDEKKLKQVFLLLTNAHYQTRPNDLQFILGDKKSFIALLSYNETIIGVALINQEGHLKPEICSDILNAKKRFKGELLPQSIISHFGLIDAGLLTYLRIMRIAIHPHLQQQGLGTYLLQEIKSIAQEKKVDFVGASFSISNQAVNFWLKNRFSCFRLSASTHSSSGQHNLEVIQSLSLKSQKIYHQLTTRFNHNLIDKIRFFYQDIDHKIIMSILLKKVFTDNNYEIPTTYELNELKRFSQSKLGFSMAAVMISKLFFSKLIQIYESKEWQSHEIEFLIACLIKQNNFKKLAIEFNLVGQKKSLEQLKLLVAKLLVTE